MTPLGSLIHDTNNIIGNLKNRADIIRFDMEEGIPLNHWEVIEFLEQKAERLITVMDTYYLSQKEQGKTLV